MPSHFSSLGLPVDTQDDFGALAVRAANEGERRGDYVCWSPSEGVELWAQVEGDQVIGLNPHFSGDARMDIAITNQVRPEGQPRLDGTFHAWANPADPDDAESGDFPFVFDVPDAGILDLPRLPVSRGLQLALFAHDFAWFADDEAFAAAQDEPRFAAESFIPIGMFGDGPPEAEGLAHGYLLDGGRRTNAESGLAFWAARVRTLGGEIDVVADVSMVEGEPAPGAVLRVGGWLSGRVLGR